MLFRSGSRAFVTLENDAAIAVIDSQAHKFMQTIQFADPTSQPRPRPMGISVRADGSMLYVTTGSFGLSGISRSPIAKRPRQIGLIIG